MNSSVYVTIFFTIIALSSTQARYYRPQNYVDWVRDKRQSHPDATEARITPFQPSLPADQPSSFVPLDYLTPPAVDAPIGGEEISPTSLTTPPPSPPQIPSQITPQISSQSPPEISPQIPPQLNPQFPQQIPPQIHPQISPHIPPQISPQIPPQISPQIPPQISPQIPPQLPPQLNPQIPSQLNPQIPFQINPQITPQIPLQGGEKWELGYDAADLLVPPVPDDHSVQYDSLKLQQSSLTPEAITVSPKLTTDELPPFEQELSASDLTGNKFESDFHGSRIQRDNRPVYSFVKTNPHGHFKWGVRIGH